mmetsp:Transcript_6990/g.10415  ORF Transcript_6990/g.10415 Transcript_6990/m.10415 type:complete len:541 (+) Transcript_6990:2-1624(+)
MEGKKIAVLLVLFILLVEETSGLQFQASQKSLRILSQATRTYAEEWVTHVVQSPEVQNGRRRVRGVDDVLEAGTMHRVFEELKRSEEWRKAWNEDEPILTRNHEGVKGWFEMSHLQQAAEEGEIGEAGRGVLDAGGSWQMRRIGHKDDTCVKWEDLDTCLSSSSTVVLNSADARCARLAALSLAAIDSFGLPVCVNVYATGSATKISAPPHTDSQRVLVLQTYGEKIWSVYKPPDQRLSSCDPLRRGKAGDILQVVNEKPVLQVTLKPGDILQVPAGWPHTTATSEDTASLHLTLGLDTHIWALDAQKARWGALKKAGLPDVLRPELDLDPRVYWQFSRKSLPRLGWTGVNFDDDVDTITQFLAESTCRVEPNRFNSTDIAITSLDLGTVAKRLLDHREALCHVQRKLYQDVIFRTGDLGLTLQKRLALHFARLEQTQTELSDWFQMSAAAVAAAFKVGAAVQVYIDDTVTFEATVDAVHPDGTYDILFFDGDFERFVPEHRLTAAVPKNAIASTSVGKRKKAKRTGFGSAGSSKNKKKR